MKCAIFGAAGFIGRHLGAHLAATGHEWVGFDVCDAPPLCSAKSFSRLDTSRDEIKLPAGTQAVYYLAQSPRYKDFPIHGDELFNVSVIGSLRAAHAAIQCGARYFCFASTGTVYAPAFSPLAESSPIRRDDPYALSKVMAEEVLSLLSGSLNITFVRLFGVFGPGQRGMLVPQIIDRIRIGRPVTIQSNPHDPRDSNGLSNSLTFVHDLVQPLLRLAEIGIKDKSVAGPLNIAGPEPITIRTLAQTIGAHLNIAPQFEMVGSRASDYIADISRLRSIMQPQFTPFSQAIKQTVAAGG